MEIIKNENILQEKEKIDKNKISRNISFPKKILQIY